MRITTSIFFVLLVMLCTACKSSYNNKASLNQDDHFNMVVEEYYQENRYYIKKYEIFYLEDRSSADKNYFLYSILPMNGEYNFVISDGWSYLPSGYIKYKNKVFFLIEEGTEAKEEPSAELLEYLHSINQLDSTQIKISLGLLKEEDAPIRKDIYDDSLEGVDYVICKHNPYKIKKCVKDSRYRKPDDEIFDVCD